MVLQSCVARIPMLRAQSTDQIRNIWGFSWFASHYGEAAATTSYHSQKWRSSMGSLAAAVHLRVASGEVFSPARGALALRD
jgi:hypothetical protein